MSSNTLKRSVNRLFKLLSGVELEQKILEIDNYYEQPWWKRKLLDRLPTRYAMDDEKFGKFWNGILYATGPTIDWNI